MWLAIDPGKSYVGWCLANGTTLHSCGVLEFAQHRQLTQWLEKQAPTQLIVEVPQIYQQKHWKGSQADIVSVALTAGTCLGGCAKTTQVLPHAWKGSVKKEIHQQRVLSEIGLRGEFAFLAQLKKLTKERQSHATDAAGLALWAIKNTKV